jgi:hypothetical protein
MEKENHKYLERYPLTKAYKYLVIGTMPPAQELPPGVICKEKKKNQRKFSIDYFYGNAASFWKIMKELYPSNKFDSIENIQKWQEEYCIGITDTIKRCKRKDPCSYKDSDLIIDWSDLNHSLKGYILNHKDKIDKLIFTSGENCNNALANFKIIMGNEFYLISGKVISDLPSPSGGSNTSNFNSNNATLGLRKDLFDYLMEMKNQSDIDYVKSQWKIKQASNKGEKINRIPKNMLTKYKVWKYKSIFPLIKCNAST